MARPRGRAVFLSLWNHSREWFHKDFCQNLNNVVSCKKIVQREEEVDKKDLLREVFRLANGPRNFRVWLGNRAEQYADKFAEFGPREQLTKRFLETGEAKIPDWIETVVEIYGKHLTDAEVKLLCEELTAQRQKYGFNQDIPNKVWSPEVAAVFEKTLSLQSELDEAMHELLPLIIRATVLIHQSRN